MKFFVLPDLMIPGVSTVGFVDFDMFELMTPASVVGSELELDVIHMEQSYRLLPNEVCGYLSWFDYAQPLCLGFDSGLGLLVLPALLNARSWLGSYTVSLIMSGSD